MSDWRLDTRLLELADSREITGTGWPHCLTVSLTVSVVTPAQSTLAVSTPGLTTTSTTSSSSCSSLTTSTSVQRDWWR